MASSDTQRQIESVQRDIDRLQRQLTEVTRQEASKSETAARLSQRLLTEKNASTVASKQRELQSCHRDIARLQGKRADLTRQVGQKTADLHKYQKTFYEQQSREQRDALASIAQRQNEFRTRTRRSMFDGLSIGAPTRGDESPTSETFDAFISHATEDKDELVRPLAEQLIEKGFSIWYDEFQLRVGDSLRRSIDRGLRLSRFGIVVLSPAFFAKNWPQYELDGLVAREQGGGKVILPLWHKVSKNEVINYSPPLADKLALNTSMYTVSELAAELATVLRENAD